MPIKFLNKIMLLCTYLRNIIQDKAMRTKKKYSKSAQSMKITTSSQNK
jgi:hypothetical protein